MAARPAWSLPPSPCGRYCAAGAGLLRRTVGLSRGCCAAAAPFCAAPSRGRGVSCWGSLRLQAASLGRGLCALCYCLSRLAAAPCCRLGAKTRPLHGRLAGCALLPCCRLGARRPAPLFPPAVLPAAAGSRCAVCSPAAKSIKTARKHTNKRQKACFLCGISPQASLYASMDSTLISPM